MKKTKLTKLLEGTDYEEEEALEALREGLFEGTSKRRWERLLRVCAYAVAYGEEAYPLPVTDRGDGSEIYDQVAAAMVKAAEEGDLPGLLDLADTFGIYLDSDELPAYCYDGVTPRR